MIYTNEPANVLYVFLTAYRASNTPQVNEIFLEGMIKHIRKFPGVYGNIESVSIQGCFKEAGQTEASIERTIKVRCVTERQASQLTDLACHKYEQDAILVVHSQTHTAHLWSVEQVGEYPNQYPRLKETPLEGTLQQVTSVAGECYSIDENGLMWEVVSK